ncbi:hypothetical protein BDN70DRAFT_402919 [Pholiota conissans]|uniref:DUF6534 domain-containing protein n=1 Tax=Pholiota conissans TaxID=109636 RepID=A0A9P5Z9M3_9AGAR|nr:hypothetical protein BDN70DRAFT_402919 [Pholiota conissans]
MPVDQGFIRNLGRDLVLAAYLNWGLMGILAIQIYAYYIAFPKDRLLAKILVYTVFLFELVQTGIVSHDVYAALASSIGVEDPLSMVNDIYNHWFTIPVAGGFTGGIGQLFFAYRIWMMTQSSAAAALQITSKSPSKGPPVIIATLAVASLVSALIAAATFFRAKTFSLLLNQEDVGAFESLASIGVWNGIGAICDIVIALSMPYYLMRHGTGLPTTHVMVVKLVRLIIETGILTAIVAILHLCLYFGNDSAFIIPGLTVSKVYANTMLVLLNNRMEIVAGRRRTQEESHDSLNSPTAFRNPATSSRQRSTIMVSNDRLTFRLNDIPPLPKPALLSKTGSRDREIDSISSKSAIVYVHKTSVQVVC